MSHKLIVETVSPNEKAIVFERCTAAKAAGIIEDFNHYTNWAQGREVYEIVYPERLSADDEEVLRDT